MDIVISHLSALRFWRRFRGDLRYAHREHCPEAMAHPVRLDAVLRDELSRLGFTATKQVPLDLLFYRDGVRSAAPGVRAHAISRRLPPGSLVRLSERVLITSPELTFAQVAGEYSPEQLIMVGCELCGAYRLLDDAGQPLPLPEERPRLTSEAQILLLLQEQGFCSRAKAARAARFVLDNARSPMEAKTALLFCLPPQLGGFGLPRPVLNPDYRLSSAARMLYPHGKCHPDLYWETAHFDVEYDGTDTHTPETLAKDVARVAALKREGLEVFTVTKAQVYDESAFIAVAEIVAERLRRELPPLTLAFGGAHARLREELGL